MELKTKFAAGFLSPEADSYLLAVSTCGLFSELGHFWYFSFFL
jgi:hypothetical protein